MTTRIHADPAQAAANVQRLRAARGWSMQRLSDELKSTPTPMVRSVVWELEHGNRAITIDELAVLARTFGLGDPWSLAGEFPPCPTCAGAPPVGFICQTRGAAAAPAGLDGMCTCPAGGRDPHCVAEACDDTSPTTERARNP